MTWREFFSSKKPVEQLGLGVALSKQGMAIASIKAGDDGPVLEQCSFVSVADDGDRQKALAAAVDGMSLGSRRCVCVLAMDDYRLTLLETPKAESDPDRNESLRLQMQNMSAFDLKDAIFQLFPLADGSDHPSHYFIAAAEKTALSRTNDLVGNNGLRLAAIDIAELAVRNVVASHEKAADGVAVLVLADSASRLWLFGGEDLYVARKLKVSTAGLNVGHAVSGDDEFALLLNDEGGGQLELSGLLSQVNRSFSYYQRNLGQRPIDTLLVASESAVLQGAKLSALVSRLNTELSADVKSFDLTSGFAKLPTFEPAYRRAVEQNPSGSVALITAIGAALRSLDSESIT